VALPAEWRETNPERAVAYAAAPDRSADNEPVDFDTQFWHRLGDTTLTCLIEEAVQHNFDVQAAQARVRAARAERARATFDLTPDAVARSGYFVRPE
jgi:outer membrane protein TolC